MTHQEIFKQMLRLQVARYIVIETKYTEHHIERTNYQDRGRYKWIAETKPNYWENVDKDKEAQRSHVDGADLFPRLYFLDESMVNELFAWLSARGLEVTDIKTPKI